MTPRAAAALSAPRSGGSAGGSAGGRSGGMSAGNRVMAGSTGFGIGVLFFGALVVAWFIYRSRTPRKVPKKKR